MKAVYKKLPEFSTDMYRSEEFYSQLQLVFTQV